jgi:putative membrane protein
VPAPSPPPFSWTSGEIHLEVVVAVALVAGLYVGARRARGEGVLAPGSLWFLAGLAWILLALNGPLHDLSDYYLFTAHMAQHLVLTLVAPPLLIAGTPAWMADALLARVFGRPGVGWLARTALRPLPALVVWTVALVTWHLPGPYGLALEVHAWHVVEHLTLVGAALLAWWPVVSPSRLAPPLHYGAQLLYLFAFGIPMTVVAAMVTGAEEVLYPFYAAAPRLFGLTPLADQRLGGVLMWVPAGVIPLTAFTIVFFRWVAAEAEDPA